MDSNNYQNNQNPTLGMEQNTYLLLMHLSQFAGYFIPGLGFIVPIVMWAVNKDKNIEVDRHGRNIMNFMISMFIYIIISIPLIFIIIGIPMLIVLCLLQFIFIIVGTVKAASGEFWKYPMAIPFFPIR